MAQVQKMYSVHNLLVKQCLEDASGNVTVAGTVDGVDIQTRDGVLTTTTNTANAALPKAGGTMSGNLVLSGANITMSGSETVDGVDISARDSVLTSTTTTANAALPKTGGAMTGAITTNSTFDGRDVATDGTKLDGIEANADVTDTANVTSAGALMDSEVTNLAQVKAFDSSDYATAAQGTTADAALPKLVAR